MGSFYSAEVAQGISDDSYGLIFGINRFLALSFQSLLTFAVADEKGFALGERDQFFVYGIYFISLGVLFAFVVCITVIKYFCEDSTIAEISSNNARKYSETSNNEENCTVANT